MKKIVNATTGEVTTRDLTPEEQAQRAADAAAAEAYKAPAAKRARIQAAINTLFNSTDAETALLANIVKEIAIDMAAQKGITAGAYRNDLISRLQS